MALVLTEADLAAYAEIGFKRPKSGQFKGWLSSRWIRDNSGPVILTCPICKGEIGKNIAVFHGQLPCIHNWQWNHAGFRYRWLLEIVVVSTSGREA